jgi:hypothetical protein
MFLPQYLREAAKKAWGIEPKPLYTRRGDPSITDKKQCPDGSVVERSESCVPDGPSGRWLFALVILGLTAPAWLTRKLNILPRTGLALAVLPQVLLGTVFWFLAIISPLPYVRWNETCLILFPFDLLLIAFLSKPNRRKYARGRVAMLGLIAALMVINVVKAPLFDLLLWPLIPALVVGFWPEPKAKPAAPATKPTSKKT